MTNVALTFARFTPGDEARWLDAALPHLSVTERTRVAALPAAQVRTQHALGRVLLRLVVTAGLTDQILIESSESGRPSLPASPEVGVSIAHSEGAVIVAVCRDAPVGVDIERPRLADADRRRVAGRRFAASEAEAMQALPDHVSGDWFARAWTIKEAVGKALGVGIFPALSGVVVSAGADAVSSVWTGPPAERWTVHQFRLPDGDEWGAVAIPATGVTLGAIEHVRLETLSSAATHPGVR